MKRVIVIGAGASGLMAACFAAKSGNSVTVLERNEKAGKKIYITGKGRCNVTNAVRPDIFLENVVRNGKFLTGCVYAFPPDRLMQMLENGGLPLKTERGNRVFPVSDHASDVTKCLIRFCEEAGVRFVFNTRVQSVKKTDPGFRVLAENEDFAADAVIVCTGGLSYPGTGSTGDGYRFAREFGLKIIDCRPSLCGIECDMRGLEGLQGLSLRNVRLTARAGRRVITYFGEMLFTHFGISGPIVLSLSASVNDGPLANFEISLDLKPALDIDTLDKRLLHDFSQYRNKQLQNALIDLLPKSMILPVLGIGQINHALPVNAVTRLQRRRICETIKNFPLHAKTLRPISEAIITAGGVDVGQINPKTMECKFVPGLYFCGEVLDVDALTGGYNLHIALATGYAAGNSV